MKQKSIVIIKFLIGWPLSLLALFFIYNTFSGKISAITLDLTTLKLQYLALGFICFLSYYFLRSLIWYTMLKFRDYHFDFAECTYLWGTSQLKRYIPGNIWSFLGLSVVFSERNVQKKHIANSIVVEEQLVLITGAILSLLSFTFVADNFLPILNNFPYIQAILLILFSSGLVLYVFLTKIIKRLHGKIGEYAKHIFPDFTPTQNLTLLCLMSVSFVFMSLGYFFVISSVINLPLGEFSSLIGLFIFSLLVGFLSFIVPTGLGVREGVLTLGLSKFTPLGIAGFVSLFARVILIMSELTAIAIAYVLMKNKSNFLGKIQAQISNNLHLTIITLGVLIYSVYFSVVSIFRYDNFYTGRFDLGNMSQTVWNTTQGRIFELTNPNGTEIVSRLSFHSDYFLILLAPFYMLWQDPRTLLVIQAVLVALGAFFIYHLANKVIKNKNIAVIFSILYLLNPALERSTLYDFHSVVPATTFILGAFYFMIEKKYRWFILFALLASITKEQIWFLIGLFGLYITFFHKKYLLGITTTVVSFLLFYLHLWHLIPLAAGDMHFAVSYYSEDSTSPTDIIKSIIFSPIESIGTVFSPEKLSYYQQLLLPLGFTSLAAPLFLIFASPDLVINVFSQKSELYTIYYQYTAVITPFIFIASIYGVKNLRSLFPKLSLTLIAIYLVITGLFSTYQSGPLPGARDANIAMFTRPHTNKQAIMSKLSEIPKSAKVTSTNNLGPQLSHREYLYTLPLGVEEADYAVFLIKDNSLKLERDTLKNVQNDENFNQVFKDGSFYIFQRK